MTTRTSFSPVRTLVGLIALAVAPATFASCTSDPRDAFRGNDPGPFSEAGSSDAAGSCEHTVCSRDLKQVLRGCEGAETVVETCGEGLGCGDGRCVPACDSAVLSKGSLGCEFATLPPDDRLFNIGDCFAAMIANTWDRPVSITAELGTEPLDLSQSVYTAQADGGNTKYTRVDGPLPPGQVGIVFLSEAKEQLELSGGILCPREVVPAYRDDPAVHGPGLTRAFRLKTDAPVSAYSIYPYGGAKGTVPTATLLLPSSSWGTNYLAVSTATLFVETPGSGKPQYGLANRTLQIVAKEDNTEVRMLPSADISPIRDVHGAVSGQATSWMLSRGQVLQLNQAKDLTGSAIESNKPVGIFGGSECVNIPVTYPYCDLTQQQILPIAQWGHEYALVPYRPRIGLEDARDRVPWSFIGAVDGTQLSYDPVRPPGAPETLAAGERVIFVTDAIVSVKSQDAAHPFYTSIYMTGHEYGGLGDPDFVNVVPSGQFLDRYVFFADFTFADTSLTLVRKKTAKGFSAVRLECSGEVTGWRPLGTSGEYEYTWIRLTKGHTPTKLADGRECGYGLHVAESDGPFGVTVWGIDIDASYGYPGGMGLRPISGIQIPVH
jgi:IgGFc binding protein